MGGACNGNGSARRNVKHVDGGEMRSANLPVSIGFFTWAFLLPKQLHR